MAVLPPLDLLRPAVEAGRAALRAMDEVPPSLRRVAASSARRLPPPFAEALLRSMDRDGWLRGRALEEAGSLDTDDDDPARAVSALFLRRPEGWRERVDAVASVRATESERVRRLAAERRVEDLAARVEELEAEVRAARAGVESAFREGREETEAARARLASSLSALRRELAAERARADEEGRRAERLEEDLAEADARIGILRERAASRSGSDRPPRNSDTARFGGGAPIEAARALDQLASVMRPAGRSEDVPPPPAPLSLPPGIRPDGREAVSWLLTLPGPVVLLVDGYNVAHDLAAVPDRTVREQVHRAAERIRRLADGPVRVVVVWDSDRDQGSTVDRSVSIRFVPHADDAIVSQVEGAQGDVVVITSDRELRERVEAAGAVALWSSALLDWIRGR